MSDRIKPENHLGQRIRVALAAANIRAAQLARACDVSPQAVHKWTEGAAYPSSRNLMTIADVTGASVEWLMWPHPVDIQTTPYAPTGDHIKTLIREVMREM